MKLLFFFKTKMIVTIRKINMKEASHLYFTLYLSFHCDMILYLGNWLSKIFILIHNYVLCCRCIFSFNKWSWNSKIEIYCIKCFFHLHTIYPYFLKRIQLKIPTHIHVLWFFWVVTRLFSLLDNKHTPWYSENALFRGDSSLKRFLFRNM